MTVNGPILGSLVTLLVTSAASICGAHGTPIDVIVDQDNQLQPFSSPDGTPLFNAGEMARIEGTDVIVSDLPGISVTNRANGVAVGTELQIDVLSGLYLWDGVSVQPSNSVMTLALPNHDEPVLVSDQSVPTYGVNWATYDGELNWEADALFLLEPVTAPKGVYGVTIRLNASSYGSGDPFLLPWVYGDYSAQQIQEGLAALRAAMTVLDGDVNGDGAVDASDAGVMFSNWGTAGLGDLNYDGIVDAADAGLMFSDWTGDSARRSVPEPSGGMLFTVFATMLFLQRGRFNEN